MSAVIEIQALRALVLPTPDEALGALGQALSLAEPEGHVRLFLDAGEPMRALLKGTAARGIAPHNVSRLLAAFDPPDRTGGRVPQPRRRPGPKI